MMKLDNQYQDQDLMGIFTKLVFLVTILELLKIS